MKKTLLSFGLGVMLVFGATAQDVDYTNLVINNSFEYAYADTVPKSGVDGWYNNTWRPWKATKTAHQKFYGWEVTDWSMRSSTNFSQALDKSASPRDKNFSITIYGDLKFGEFWELYQVIDKASLPAGIYKVQARLSIENLVRTSQRLFANQNVQYHGAAAQYVNNLTRGEVNTFSGYPGTTNVLEEMTVYTTIGEDDDLRIGIRTGGKMSDGTMAEDAGTSGTLVGSFKADYFRVTKIDPAMLMPHFLHCR